MTAPSTSAMSHVAVCEADEVASTVLTRILQSDGYQVAVYETAAACLEAAAALLPAAVVTAILLPDTDGLALTHQLRTTYGNRLRIVVVSALRSEQRALEMGADAFCAKPVRRETLLSAVRSPIAQEAS